MVPDPRLRWTDERIDDMQRDLEKLEERQDAARNLLAALDLQFVEYQRERKVQQTQKTKKEERNWELRIGLLLVFVGQLGTVLALVLHH